jgi:hypothetical protein
MASVGLLNDNVSALCCQRFVGSDTSGKDSVNFIMQFDTTCSDLFSSENECLCCINLNSKLKCALDEVSSLNLIIRLLWNELVILNWEFS